MLSGDFALKEAKARTAADPSTPLPPQRRRPVAGDPGCATLIRMTDGGFAFVISHPSDKNKDVAWMGHPGLWLVRSDKCNSRAAADPSPSLRKTAFVGVTPCRSGGR